MSEAYIQDVPKGEYRDIEVTGVDFFETIQKMPFLRSLYDLANRKLFDIYDVTN